MNIEFVDLDGNKVSDCELDCMPFTVGQTININVKNHDNEFWKVNEIRNVKYVIENIEHYLDITYTAKPSCITRFTTSITVSKDYKLNN